MDSFNLQKNIKVKVEKNNVIVRYQRRITSLIRFTQLCTFFFIISTFSSQLLPSAEFFKGLCLTLTSPLFVFLLGNAIVIMLFLLKSCQSTTKDCTTVDHPKVDVEYKTCIIPSGRQIKMKIYRSQSEKLMNKPNNRLLRRSTTVACGRCDKKPAAEMTGEEFRRTVEAFIARQQRFLREEEFSAIVSNDA